MQDQAEPRLNPSCSFCGKSEKEVEAFVYGPGVHICEECVELCIGVIKEIKSKKDPSISPNSK